MRVRAALLTAAALIVPGGCGPGNGLDLAPVSGKVTFQGQPIENGTIMFEPDDTQGTTGPQAVGTIKADGTYILSSQDPGDGAVVGTHRIAVLGLETEPVAAEEALPNPEEDPLKYLAAKTEAAVKSSRERRKGQPADTVTGLDGKTFRMVIPKKLSSTSTSGLTTKVTSGSNTINIDIHEDGTATIR